MGTMQSGAGAVRRPRNNNITEESNYVFISGKVLSNSETFVRLAWH